MESKYTPGPWYFDQNSCVWTGDQRLKDNDGYVIAECYGTTQKKANANLIAAAPCLLEALQELAEQFETVVPRYSKDEQVLTKATAAINKALNK